MSSSKKATIEKFEYHFVHIDFVDAALLLCETPFMAQDTRHNYDETHCHAVGEYKGLVLHVTFTLRIHRHSYETRPIFRIISARRASAKERKSYEELKGKYD